MAREFPLDRRTVYAIGQALGHHLPQGPRRIVIGQDTRESSPWIAEVLSAGLRDSGVQIDTAGVITTPGVAYLARTQGFSAGVVISASHNPWQDNGIKIFGGDGYKLADAIELEIETEIFAQLNSKYTFDPAIPLGSSLPGDTRLRAAYVEWLGRPIPGAERLKVVVDCANGAASNCGALHPEAVAAEVVRRRTDLGICFDGDADRALFADSQGNIVNGDAVMLLLARELKQRGELAKDTVVATTMSNMGLEIALREAGIQMLRAPVGDKYVLEEMKQTGAVLGGEQSGHIILSRESTTGDGLLTAIHLIEILCRTGKPLSQLVAGLKVFPQTIKNVRVRDKRPLDQIPEVMSAIRSAEQELNGNGRVNVRYSGTESLARVMVEAPAIETVNKHADKIVGAIQKALGA